MGKAAVWHGARLPVEGLDAVLRHKDNNKWYGLIMEVGRDKLGMTGDGEVDVLNVKCEPILIGSLRMQEGFFPAYHMNKDSWISILLEGPVADEEIKNLLDLSYKMTVQKKRGSDGRKEKSLT